MRKLTLLACVSAVTLLAACDPHYDNGYYDANGNYVSSTTATGAQRNHNNDTWPGKPIGYYNDSNNYNNDPAYREHRPIRPARRSSAYYDEQYLYQLPGVYNLDGDYLGTAQSYGVPSSIVPSRGLCTVWFPDRMRYDQPAAQNCDGLINRAPSGSLIVFGG